MEQNTVQFDLSTSIIIQTPRGDIHVDFEDITVLEAMIDVVEGYDDELKKLEKKTKLGANKSTTVPKGKVLSERDRYGLQLQKETINNLKAKFDSFLGEGACDKIFGKRMSLTMFPQLIDQLQPVIEQATARAKVKVDNIRDKYDIKEEANVL